MTKDRLPDHDSLDEKRPRHEGRANGPGLFADKDWWILLAVVTLALLIRVLYLLQFRSSPYFSHEAMDQGFHVAWAQAFAAGKAFVEGPYFRAPLYPWFLGVLFKAFGDNFFAIRLIQMILGSVSCGLLYAVSRQAFGRVVSVVAAVAAALYWPLIYFDGEFLIPVLSIFLNLLLLWSLFRFFKRPGLWGGVHSGLLLGLSAIARPNVLLFAPFVAIWIATFRPRGSRSVVRGLVFCAAVLIPIVPITIRNATIGGDTVLIASQGGVNFYIGNNQHASGVDARLPGIEANVQNMYQGTIRRAEQQVGRSLKPSEASRHYFSLALDYMTERPADAAKLMGRKLKYFWTRREITNNKNIYFLTDRYAPAVRILPFGFWILGPLGLVGLVACRGRARGLFPLWGFVVTYMVGVVLFFVTARFRLPVVVVLFPLAAYGVAQLWEGIRQRKWTAVAAMILAGIVGTALATATPPMSSDRNDKALVDLARVLQEQGRNRASLELLDEALAENPRNIEGLYMRALNNQQLRRTDLAIRAYEEALTIDPRHVSTLNNLSGLLLSKQRTDEAIPYLEKVIALEPNRWSGYINLGKAYASSRRFGDCVDAYEKGLRLNPEHLETWVHLAWLRATVNDPKVLSCEGARSAAETAVRMTNRQHGSALEALSAAYARCGELDKAVETIEEALRMAQAVGDQANLRRLLPLRESYRRGEAPLFEPDEIPVN